MSERSELRRPARRVSPAARGATRELLCRLCVLLLAGWLLAGPLAAHSYHTTVAEVTLNADAGRLEVALRALPEDLERALERHSGQRVRLELTAGVDESIMAYLRDHFVVTQAGERRALTWVGKEVSAQAVWLYFEIDAPKGIAGATLEQSTFFELEAKQVNTVRFTAGERRLTLTFTRERPVRTLASDAP